MNVSEGTDATVVSRLVEAIRRFPGLRILEVASDADHNRSVFTYLGEPQPVLEATQALAAKALELIDMRGTRLAPPPGGRGCRAFYTGAGHGRGRGGRDFPRTSAALWAAWASRSITMKRPPGTRDADNCPISAGASTKGWLRN